MENAAATISSGTQVDAPNGFQVANCRAGHANFKLASQWRDRPDDQKFLDLTTLYDFKKQQAAQSRQTVLDARDIVVEADRDSYERLNLRLPETAGTDVITAPTHWSFNQVCSLMQPRVPADYLRTLPGFIAGVNLQYALAQFRGAPVMAYIRQNGESELSAVTGPTYGRVFDHEAVAAVMKVAGNGIGDTRWKVPGVMDWGTMHYDPNAPVTKQSTTLFASDRDIFLFLTDDKHPIDIGLAPNGQRDLLMRGFMVWNSEYGARSLGIATFYYRAVCCNRILWGVEGYEEIRLIHSKGAPERFASEVAPALEDYADARDSKLLLGVKAARAAIVATNDEERVEFLGKQGFTKSGVQQVLEAVEREENTKARSVWDFVQGITAVARDEGRQDQRLVMESKAKTLLNKVKV